jgi:hypothetical protein
MEKPIKMMKMDLIVMKIILDVLILFMVAAKME